MNKIYYNRVPQYLFDIANINSKEIQLCTTIHCIFFEYYLLLVKRIPLASVLIMKVRICFPELHTMDMNNNLSQML